MAPRLASGWATLSSRAMRTGPWEGCAMRWASTAWRQGQVATRLGCFGVVPRSCGESRFTRFSMRLLLAP